MGSKIPQPPPTDGRAARPSAPPPRVLCVCKQIDDVRLVRLRVNGKATLYYQHETPLCRMCRDRLRGSWMYAERAG